MPDHIYKIASADAFPPAIALPKAGAPPDFNLAAAARQSFAGMPVDAQDGYIHFSTATQLAETLRRHFAGQAGLVLMAVPPDALGDGLKWEPSRGGQLFPHLYGPLPMSAVTAWGRVDVASDGAVVLPDWVR